MTRLIALLFACGTALVFAAAPGIPSYVSLPVATPSGDEVTYENYGQHEFTLRDKTEIHRGRHWTAYAGYADKLGDDPRRALVAFVNTMKKGGWDIAMQDEPRNPPLATFHYTKNGKDAWAEVEIGEQAGIRVIESGPPSAKLDLAPPARSGEKVAAGVDFPYLKRYPGSKLATTSEHEPPLLVAIDPDKEPVQVSSGSIVKDYQGPEGLGAIEVIAVYADALKRAGWTIVEEATGISQGDPYLTAHYAKDTTEIWAHVHSRPGEGYTLTVADAGGERAASAVKAQLDRTCKVEVYGINFDFDKASLKSGSEPALDSILQVFRAYPDLQLELAGHTDNVGKPEYNAKLSDARVNTVRGWLVGKGVNAERITAKGYGDSQPIASNESAEGRARNRRVELRKRGC
jgi:outer membrane protein OmpA-like peptidoglycan-associated protein